MMGWVILTALLVVAALVLWRARVSGGVLRLALAALMLGAAGYALQGRPSLTGSPTEAQRATRPMDPGQLALRRSMFGQFVFSDQYFIASDAMLRTGKTEAAAKVLLSGLQQSPRDPALWAGLGLALQEHDGNALSPPARRAFARAVQLGPDQPGVWFYLGLAHVRAGDFVRARGAWARAARLARPGSDASQSIMTRLVLLDGVLASQPGAEGATAPRR
ncbi:hypothetical protein NYR55_06015 [Sphingomonas sp. BGYR3]|uniref:tetratricopeptide repeat protein n=1 Tax=Sphingomonas sp. BGYR3 TaxID=2975483 RepID=UPI0021A8945E|nr:tetratricopeptide repeat protein [Sphingomonas sp. BGYR3]MDG5488175.1 hypothetical protein [Sphingomonas sp. BGYR3]